MSVSNSYTIVHFLENDDSGNPRHDFNTYGIPHELRRHLIKHIKDEMDDYNQKQFAKEMRLERARQNDMYLDHCKANDLEPKQIFIDFPLR